MFLFALFVLFLCGFLVSLSFDFVVFSYFITFLFLYVFFCVVRVFVSPLCVFNFGVCRWLFVYHYLVCCHSCHCYFYFCFLFIYLFLFYFVYLCLCIFIFVIAFLDCGVLAFYFMVVGPLLFNLLLVAGFVHRYVLWCVLVLSVFCCRFFVSGFYVWFCICLFACFGCWFLHFCLYASPLEVRFIFIIRFRVDSVCIVLFVSRSL